jgi:hypothetical protein
MSIPSNPSNLNALGMVSVLHTATTIRLPHSEFDVQGVVLTVYSHGTLRSGWQQSYLMPIRE